MPKKRAKKDPNAPRRPMVRFIEFAKVKSHSYNFATRKRVPFSNSAKTLARGSKMKTRILKIQIYHNCLYVLLFSIRKASKLLVYRVLFGNLPHPRSRIHMLNEKRSREPLTKRVCNNTKPKKRKKMLQSVPVMKRFDLKPPSQATFNSSATEIRTFSALTAAAILRTTRETIRTNKIAPNQSMRGTK